jgi:hypothetical protein
MATNVSRSIQAAKPTVSKIWQTTGMLAFCARQRGDTSGQRGGSRRRRGPLEAMPASSAQVRWGGGGGAAEDRGCSSAGFIGVALCRHGRQPINRKPRPCDRPGPAVLGGVGGAGGPPSRI